MESNDTVYCIKAPKPLLAPRENHYIDGLTHLCPTLLLLLLSLLDLLPVDLVTYQTN